MTSFQLGFFYKCWWRHQHWRVPWLVSPPTTQLQQLTVKNIFSFKIHSKRRQGFEPFQRLIPLKPRPKSTPNRSLLFLRPVD